jgi:hypothetical protein
MQIRLGYGLIYKWHQLRLVILALNIHYTRVSDLLIKRCGLRKTVALPDGDGLQYRPLDATPTPLQLGPGPRAPMAGDGGSRGGNVDERDRPA